MENVLSVVHLLLLTIVTDLKINRIFQRHAIHRKQIPCEILNYSNISSVRSIPNRLEGGEVRSNRVKR